MKGQAALSSARECSDKKQKVFLERRRSAKNQTRQRPGDKQPATAMTALSLKPLRVRSAPPNARCDKSRSDNRTLSVAWNAQSLTKIVATCCTDITHSRYEETAIAEFGDLVAIAWLRSLPLEVTGDSVVESNCHRILLSKACRIRKRQERRQATLSLEAVVAAICSQKAVGLRSDKKELHLVKRE